MDQETSGRKCCFAIQGLFWLVCFGAMGGIYIFSLKRANEIDDFFCPNLDGTQCKLIDGKAYDLIFVDGPWKDEDLDEYQKLFKEINRWDNDKKAKGSRFELIYKFCGITFLALAFSFMCMAIGSYVLYARVLGLCTGCLFSCVNFAAIITTGVFRFNAAGKLAAIS